MFNTRFLFATILMAAVTVPAFAMDAQPAAEGEHRFIPVTESTPLKAHVYANYTGRKYLLGPNDVISIKVFDAEEFTHEQVLVQPDGHITIAPFGMINVAGKTLGGLQDELTEKLKFYLRDPKVTITLDKTKPFSVYVSGAVLRPGMYEMVTDVNRNQLVADNTPEILLERKSPLLSNVLVAAGGIDYDADLEHVRITNKFDGSSFEVNLLELVQNGDSAQDLFLIAGDSVHVPELPTPYAVDEAKYQAIKGSTIFQKEIPVRVYGYVNRPGLIRLDSAQSANLNSAIGAAGGFLNENNGSASYAPDYVLVSRVDGNGRLATTKVDPRKEDMALRPNDIVYVPEKARPKIGKAFDFLNRVVDPIAGVANAANNWALLFDPLRFNLNFSRR